MSHTITDEQIARAVKRIDAAKDYRADPQQIIGILAHLFPLLPSEVTQAILHALPPVRERATRTSPANMTAHPRSTE